jgi:hypothetical protein
MEPALSPRIPLRSSFIRKKIDGISYQTHALIVYKNKHTGEEYALREVLISPKVVSLFSKYVEYEYQALQ